MEWAQLQGYSAVWNDLYFFGYISSIGSFTCQKAAEYGQLQALQWLRDNGCNWGAEICAAAAANGHLFILQWLREKGCDWDMYTCEAAAANGHLPCLQWARENGCPEYYSEDEYPAPIWAEELWG